VARFSAKIRGMDCEVEGNICGPDPDVGIFGAWMDEYTVFDPDGRVLDDITDKEYEAICEAADDYSRYDPEAP